MLGAIITMSQLKDQQLRFEAPAGKVIPGLNPGYLHVGHIFIFEIGTGMESSVLMEGSELIHPLINQLTK